MKRGELWTLRDTGYASKPRPVLIVQDEKVGHFESIILCLLTSFDSGEMEWRVMVEPTDENGLNTTSFIMADKIVTVKKAQLGQCIGTISSRELSKVDAALAKILGISRDNEN